MKKWIVLGFVFLTILNIAWLTHYYLNQKSENHFNYKNEMIINMLTRFDTYADDYSDECIFIDKEDSNSFIYRDFYICSGISDISEEVNTSNDSLKYKKLFELNNVEELSIYLFYIDEYSYQIPDFPSYYSLYRENKIDFSKLKYKEGFLENLPNKWKFLFYYSICLDIDSSIKMGYGKLANQIEPIYPNKNIKMTLPDYYNDSLLFPILSLSHYPNDSVFTNKTRFFKFKLKIPKVAGDYKLRVDSRTNRLLGIMNAIPIVKQHIREYSNIKREYLINFMNECKQEYSYLNLPELVLDPKDKFFFNKYEASYIKIYELLKKYRDPKSLQVLQLLRNMFRVINNCYPEFIVSQSTGYVDFDIRIRKK